MLLGTSENQSWGRGTDVAHAGDACAHMVRAPAAASSCWVETNNSCSLDTDGGDTMESETSDPPHSHQVTGWPGASNA